MLLNPIPNNFVNVFFFENTVLTIIHALILFLLLFIFRVIVIIQQQVCVGIFPIQLLSAIGQSGNRLTLDEGLVKNKLWGQTDNIALHCSILDHLFLA